MRPWCGSTPVVTPVRRSSFLCSLFLFRRRRRRRRSLAGCIMLYDVSALVLHRMRNARMEYRYMEARHRAVFVCHRTVVVLSISPDPPRENPTCRVTSPPDQEIQLDSRRRRSRVLSLEELRRDLAATVAPHTQGSGGQWGIRGMFSTASHQVELEAEVCWASEMV